MQNFCFMNNFRNLDLARKLCFEVTVSWMHLYLLLSHSKPVGIRTSQVTAIPPPGSDEGTQMRHNPVTGLLLILNSWPTTTIIIVLWNLPVHNSPRTARDGIILLIIIIIKRRVEFMNYVVDVKMN
jgi:hypothetical protein